MDFKTCSVGFTYIHDETTLTKT